MEVFRLHHFNIKFGQFIYLTNKIDQPNKTKAWPGSQNRPQDHKYAQKRIRGAAAVLGCSPLYFPTPVLTGGLLGLFLTRGKAPYFSLPVLHGTAMHQCIILSKEVRLLSVIYSALHEYLHAGAREVGATEDILLVFPRYGRNQKPSPMFQDLCVRVHVP